MPAKVRKPLGWTMFFIWWRNGEVGAVCYHRNRPSRPPTHWDLLLRRHVTMETTFPPTCWDLLLWRLVAMETTFPPTCWLSHRDVLYSPPPPCFHFKLILLSHLCSLIPRLLGRLYLLPWAFGRVLPRCIAVVLLHVRNPYLAQYFLTPHFKAQWQHLG